MKINKFCTLLNERREEYLCSEGYAKAEYKNTLNEPKIIADYINTAYNGNIQPIEKVWLICLDNQLRIQGSFEISMGTCNYTITPTREIFKNALMVGAHNITIVHNHPSGSAEPSKTDLKTTEKLIEAGKLLDLPVIDHIILGETNYYSMRTAYQNGKIYLKTNGSWT